MDPLANSAFFRNEDKIFSSACPLAENCTSIEKSFNPDVGSVEDGAAAIGTVAHASVTVTIAGTGIVDSNSITLGSVIFGVALAAFKTSCLKPLGLPDRMGGGGNFQ